MELTEEEKLLKTEYEQCIQELNNYREMVKSKPYVSWISRLLTALFVFSLVFFTTGYITIEYIFIDSTGVVQEAIIKMLVAYSSISALIFTFLIPFNRYIFILFGISLPRNVYFFKSALLTNEWYEVCKKIQKFQYEYGSKRTKEVFGVTYGEL